MTTPELTFTEDFERALDLLDSGAHMFLTGRAGTGKSTLIRHFLATTGRRAITVAPTGIAALNVDGYTIHRLFSFPMGVTEEHVRGPRYFPGRFAQTLAELDTLIVDEASMVRADLFDALAAALERFGPKHGEPFGGVQLVLVGDLHQLPPVVRDDEVAFFDERFGTPYFFSARHFDRDRFAVVELTTVFRQIGDSGLVDILNAVREGSLLDDARAALNARTDPDFEPPEDEFWLTLATTNRIVGARNRHMLDRLPAPVRSYRAEIEGDTDGFEHPTEASLDLAVGAQVMLLNNDPLDRWANGTLGRILELTKDRDGPVVHVGLREGVTVHVRPHTWEITRPVASGGAVRHEVVGRFTQLPMKLAWAITIHKSQGQTLHRVVVDLTGGTFANGQLYVALSRCTSLDGLVLRRDVLPRDLKTDGRIRRFLASSGRGGGDDADAGRVYVSVLTVGSVGDRYRPRPVEIAVVTDEGDEATTVVNPTSDLYGAQEEFGITVRDVQLAPVLTEAWACLSPLLAGRVPVGVGIDRTLGWIDFELKRHGVVEPMALGSELPVAALRSAERDALETGTALERARAMRDAGERWLRDSYGELEAGTAFPAWSRGRGFLQARVSGPGAVLGAEGFVVGGNLSAEDDPSAVMAEMLAGAWQRVIAHDEHVLARVRAAERHFGVDVLPPDLEAAGPVEAAAVLGPGARVCFTGTVVSATRGVVDRDLMMRWAADAGLVPVPSVTKTRTDVLVVAERGTQSGKARKAAQWGTPVIAAEDFLAWLDARGL
ncbi:AAA family ATPase [Demequina sp. SYSU T00b26]|uniref:AAA family ATPase n=2 Tax=Demequina zhanjiangensis TaxID=3051659 RepID=A0ABT8FYD5_9MICO|nr:AAA family ATPase [Demequina sp. SYSU T00b26]MDN4471906.1 AAA family ATPase [Demequina sp. SYSU T00b26]